MAKKNLAADAQSAKDALTRKAGPVEPPIGPNDWLSTGSGLLNLALSGRIDGGFAKGRYFHLVGDSDSGKTMFSMTAYAEAAVNKYFDKYRFVFYNREDGALMDFARFFGPRMAARVEVVRARDIPTVESLYYHLDDQFKKGPIIAVVDSMDAFTSEADDEKFDKRKKAYEEGKDAAGSFGMAKAKANSGNIGKVIGNMEKTGSIIIAISQSRDNVNPMSYEPKTHSGGRAVKFYAAAQIWTSPGPKLFKSYKGQNIQTGITANIYVKKNRLTGKEWQVTVPIYHTVGIDELGSFVDFLVLWKRWTPGKAEGKEELKPKQGAKVAKGVIVATDFEMQGSREALIKYIEDNNLENELRMIVQEEWQKIEAACAVPRKPRYE